jgi:hypothetical protein
MSDNPKIKILSLKNSKIENESRVKNNFLIRISDGKAKEAKPIFEKKNKLL